MKILAVDDDPEILDVLQATLASYGYEDVFLCETGQDGLEEVSDRFEPVSVWVVSDKFEPVSVCPQVRESMRNKETATRRGRRRGSA